MKSKYNRPKTLDNFVEALYKCANKELGKNEPDFVKEFNRGINAGENADIVIANAMPFIKGKMREWEVVLEKTYEVELYFVKLGYAAMLLSLDPPKGMVGYQPLTDREFYQYNFDSFFIVLDSLINRVIGLTKYIERNFIPKIYNSGDEAIIENDRCILKEIRTNMGELKNKVTKVRDPMIHWRSPGVRALEEERYWYLYMALDKRLDLVESYYSDVENRRVFRTKILNDGAVKTFAMVEQTFKKMLNLGFLQKI